MTAESVSSVLKNVPLGTKWSDLPVEVREKLASAAASRLTDFRSRWGAEALRAKHAILQKCPTSEMVSAIDDFFRRSYPVLLPGTFTLSNLKDQKFQKALRAVYLGSVAANRATLAYPNFELPNRDWDGRSKFDSVRLPDQASYQAIKQLNVQVVRLLRDVDARRLDATERELHARSLLTARVLSQGGFDGGSYGGSDQEAPCQLVNRHYDVLMGYKGDRARPVIFADDEEVLQEVNAIFLHNTKLKWLDRGTRSTAINFSLCNGITDDDIVEYIGPLSSNEVAKGVKLLSAWWIERLEQNKDGDRKCTIYSAADRASVWEAFSADQKLDGKAFVSMEAYKRRLDLYRQSKLKAHRTAAIQALALVFPGSGALSDASRKHVLAAIDKDAEFGLFVDKVALFLIEAGDNAAADAWRAAVKSKVKRIGGYRPGETVRDADKQAIDQIYAGTKRWVIDNYKGYPVDLAKLFDWIVLEATTSDVSTTANATGAIKIGIGTSRSVAEYYSTVLHEIRHAVRAAWRAHTADISKTGNDEGAAFEGSGVAVEELLLMPMLRQLLNDELALALYTLDYGIRDARFVGTTDATLSKYYRESCSGRSDPDTIEFAKGIAEGHGLTGRLADTAAMRAHAGTQYLQYVASGLKIVDDIAYLRGALKLTKEKLDPFVLFACDLNTPYRDPKYMAALQVCVRGSKP